MQDNERQMSSFEQVVRQATTRVDASFRDTDQNVGRLGATAVGTARDVSRVGTSATDIARVSTESRQATTQVRNVGEAARTTARDVSQIGDAARTATRELETTGDESGRDVGGNFLSGFSDALSSLPSKAGPVAGSILGIAALGIGAGVALAAAIKEGMEAELSRDMFQAQTGVTTAQAEKFARAAGEAYADVFGASVEENLSTLKLALQQNIIDPSATQRDAEAVVANLDTITAALDGDLTMSVNAVSALMSTGLATSAQEASDMIANAVGGSANRGEDLLEVVNEYSAGWKNAGISAEMALALIEQSTDAGAWNADVAGDSLREFGRRVSEEGDTIVTALDDIGLNGQEMFEAFKRGGPDANEAFDLAFDTISKIEDPVKRNTAAMSLLGDTSGDFISTLSSWDPSKALNDFGEFEGAAGRLAATMGGNAATSVEGAMRSISTVIDGLKGALAEAFGPEIAEWAAAISNNRAGVIDFFIGVGNGAFEGSKAVAGFVSGGIRSLASFVDAGTDMSVSFLRSIADMVGGMDGFLGAFGPIGAALGIVIPDMGDAADKMRALADAAESGGGKSADALNSAADAIDSKLIPGIDNAQERFNHFAENMRLSAAFNDESAKVTASISEIGVAADGSMYKLESFNGKALNLLPPGMTDSVRALADGFEEQVRTGLEAGNTVEALTGQYEANRGALIDQLMATGMSNKAAVEYINTLGLTPELVATLIEQPGMPEAHYALDVLNEKVVGIPDEKTVTVQSLTDDAKSDLEALGFTVQENTKDGTVTIIAATDEAAEQLRLFRERNRELHMNLTLSAVDGPRGITAGQQVSSVDWSAVPRSERADGAFTPKNTQAHIQNSQLTVYGEPETEGESYIPHAPSKRVRSMSILSETARKFGLGLVRSFADGGVINKDGLDASMAWAQSMDPATYQMGGFSSSAIDCSGAVSGAINKALGLDAFDSRMSTVTEGSWLQAKGAILGKGPEGTIRVGWWDEGGGANGHTAMTYADGTNFESNGSEGVVVGGPTGWDDPSFTDHAWFPNSGDLGLASDTGTGSSAAITDSNGGGSGDASDVVYGQTESGALLSTDGQKVFVTNWPSQLGGSDAPAEERKPILTAGLKVFANGGVEDHTAQIAGAGDMRVWAEPETGGEAYIPLGSSKRGRSLAITSDVAKRFGYQLVPMADGGLTGFGGWQNDDKPTLDIPLDGKGVSPNKARANAYALTALGVGGLNTLLSGFDGKGNFTGKFDTGSNSPALLEEGVSMITGKLDELIEAAKNPDPVSVDVNIDQGNRSAEIAIMKAGL